MGSSITPRVRRLRTHASSRRRGPVIARILLTYGLLLLGLGLVGSVSAEEPRTSFLETQEGRRLVMVWHAMLNHSSDAFYSPSLFRGLASDLGTADSDLAALRERGVLAKPVAEQLRTLFHMRYRYIGECHYSNRSTIRVSGAEASRTAAQWVIELQLSVLRRSQTSQADRELAKAARENLAYQLTFIHHLDAFEAESDRRRIELQKREVGEQDSESAAFEAEYQRKRNRLVEAYQQRRLPGVRSVDGIIPYLVALTRANPVPHAAAGGPALPGS